MQFKKRLTTIKNDIFFNHMYWLTICIWLKYWLFNDNIWSEPKKMMTSLNYCLNWSNIYIFHSFNVFICLVSGQIKHIILFPKYSHKNSRNTSLATLCRCDMQESTINKPLSQLFRTLCITGQSYQVLRKLNLYGTCLYMHCN